MGYISIKADEVEVVQRRNKEVSSKEVSSKKVFPTRAPVMWVSMAETSD